MGLYQSMYWPELYSQLCLLEIDQITLPMQLIFFLLILFYLTYLNCELLFAMTPTPPMGL